MDIFSWLAKGTGLLYFLPSMMVLLVVIVVCVRIYVLLFVKTLSPKVFKTLLVPVVLLGFIIWAIPMNMGFYDFFRTKFS